MIDLIHDFGDIEYSLQGWKTSSQEEADKTVAWYRYAFEELEWASKSIGELLPSARNYHISIFHVMTEYEQKYLKQPKGVVLVCPHGNRIAEDIDSFNKRFGADITRIEYSPAEEGFIAIFFENHNEMASRGLFSQYFRALNTTLGESLSNEELYSLYGAN